MKFLFWLWCQWINKKNEIFYLHNFYYIFFLFFIFLFLGWAVLNPAQHIYWWLGWAQPHRSWARPSQPGPVTGPSQWPTSKLQCFNNIIIINKDTKIIWKQRRVHEQRKDCSKLLKHFKVFNTLSWSGVCISHCR